MFRRADRSRDVAVVGAGRAAEAVSVFACSQTEARMRTFETCSYAVGIESVNRILLLLVVSFVFPQLVGCTSKDKKAAQKPVVQSAAGADANDVQSSDQPGETDSDAAESNAVDNTAQAKEAEPVVFEAGESAWIGADKLPWEASFLQFINGKRMGYAKLSVLPPTLSSSKQVTVKRVDSVEFTRAGQTVRVLVSLDALEHSDGRLLEFTETTLNGGQEFKTKAQLVRGVLQLKTTFAETTKSESVIIPHGTWGVLGLQAVLMQDPMESGDRRTAKIYVPSLHSVVDAELIAGEPEETALLDGSRVKLLPVEYVQKFSDQNGSRSINWVNEIGEIQKTVTLTGTSISWFRTSADNVQGIEDGYTLADEALATYMPLAGTTDMLGGATQVTFMVDGDGVDPYEVIPSGAMQSVTSVTARRGAVVNDVAAEASFTAPENIAELLAASPVIEKDYSKLSELLTAWAGDSDEPGDIADSLMKGLYSDFKHEPRIDGFATAYELLTEKSGNSLEQAALLVALLRNKEIPARVACGLLASASDKRLHLHAWTEAWIDDKWVGLDSMIGSKIGPLHIKVTDSPMSGENPFTVVMPVVELLPSLRIAVSVAK